MSLFRIPALVVGLAVAGVAQRLARNDDAQLP